MSNDSSEPAAPTESPKVPWNPWLGLVFVVLVYYVSQILSGILISLYPALSSWTDAEALRWLNDSITAQFFYVLGAEALALGAVYLFLKQYGLKFSGIGLRRPKWSDAAYGLAALPVYFLLYGITAVAASQLLPELDLEQKQHLGFDNLAGSLHMTMAFISLVILPPITEEIMFRGFLYGSLKKAMPIIMAALVTSAMFAIAHLPGGGPTGPLYIAAIDTFVLSLVLIYLREKTNGLWAPISLHAFKNGVAYLILFVFRIV